MREYYCGCCGMRLDSSEVNTVWDDNLNEVYVCCRNCGSECFGCEDEEELDEEDDFGEDDFDENE